MWKYIQKKLYSWEAITAVANQSAYNQRQHVLHDLCSRLPISRMRELLDEAERSGDKYTTLARLLENNI